MIIGSNKSKLDTPALWVDLDLMESNIQRLASFFKDAGVEWRPHTKGIKIPAIAHKILEAGAIGVTCAKLSEAVVMASSGVKDILVANQVVGFQKITRLVKLRHWADVIVAVDNWENVKNISHAAADEGVAIGVLIEVNCGIARAGLEPGEPVVEFAKKIVDSSLPGVKLAGLMGWEGHAVAIEDSEEKKRVIHEAVGSLVHSAEMCRDDEIEIPIVSCGGSGTYQITSHISGVTEIQAGGAVFTDVAYRNWGVELDPSLFVQTTVTSRPAPTRAIVDAGRKALDDRAAVPQPRKLKGVNLSSLHAEHGILTLDSADHPLKVGDKFDFIVGYGDNTVYLYDTLYGVRNGEVEAIWPILGRGKLT